MKVEKEYKAMIGNIRLDPSANGWCMPMPLLPRCRAGGGAPEMENRLSTLATCGFGVRTSLEATTD